MTKKHKTLLSIAIFLTTSLTPTNGNIVSANNNQFLIIADEENNHCVDNSTQLLICSHEEQNETPYLSILKEATKLAIMEELVISEMPRTYSRSCTERPYGCEAHIEAIVDLFYQYQDRGIDPLILAAIAKHETNFNPFAVNESTGAAGLLQLMPRSRFADGIEFIHNRNYREQCKQELSSCQEEVLDASVTLLERSIRRCGNNLRHGLGMYGSGSCEGSQRFANYVIRLSRQFRERQMHYVHILSEKQAIHVISECSYNR